MKKKETAKFCPKDKSEWRSWLESNHIIEESVWLIIHKKDSEYSNLNWSEAVDEALCFGWIDSVKRTVDSKKYQQFFSKRKANSTWSKINKIKIKELLNEGLIKEAGHKTIEIAKENGSWTILDEVEALIIPKDLENEFKKHDGSKDFFLNHSKSVKKSLLQWIVLAKRPETRKNRVEAIAKSAGNKMRPKQFR